LNGKYKRIREREGICVFVLVKAYLFIKGTNYHSLDQEESIIEDIILLKTPLNSAI